MKPEDLTIKAVEQAISLPVEDWHGKCYEIACMIVKAKLVKGVAVYGHYTGPVAKTGFWASRRGSPFQRHGWVILDDGRILDPTRWSFEDKEPYLYIFELPDDIIAICETCDHVDDEHERGGFFNSCTIEKCGCDDFVKKKVVSEYDEGGNGLRESMMTPPPPFKDGDKVERLPVEGEAKTFVMEALGHPKAINMAMIFWLGNLPVKKLGPFAPDVYKALIKAGREAIIPTDNRRMVLGTYG